MLSFGDMVLNEGERVKLNFDAGKSPTSRWQVGRQMSDFLRGATKNVRLFQPRKLAPKVGHCFLLFQLSNFDIGVRRFKIDHFTAAIQYIFRPNFLFIFVLDV